MKAKAKMQTTTKQKPKTSLVLKLYLKMLFFILKGGGKVSFFRVLAIAIKWFIVIWNLRNYGFNGQ